MIIITIFYYIAMTLPIYHYPFISYISFINLLFIVFYHISFFSITFYHFCLHSFFTNYPSRTKSGTGYYASIDSKSKADFIYVQPVISQVKCVYQAFYKYSNRRPADLSVGATEASLRLPYPELRNQFPQSKRYLVSG